MSLKSLLERLEHKTGGRVTLGSLLSPVVTLSILFGISCFIQLRIEHYLLAVLFVVLPFFGHKVRQLTVIGALFAIVFLCYDLMPYVLPLRGEIHTGDLWELERTLFSLPGKTETVGDFLATHPLPFLDLVTGFAYITYMVAVVSLSFVFCWTGDLRRAYRLALGFMIINYAGWAVWILWPAAPPWYIDAYGVGPAVLDAAPSAAGAARFDALLGVPIFEGFYSRNANIFGAMPSLHVGYAVLGAAAAWSFHPKWRVATLVHSALLFFSAVYLRHHYILDALGGLVLAVLSDRAAKLIVDRLSPLPPAVEAIHPPEPVVTRSPA